MARTTTKRRLILALAVALAIAAALLAVLALGDDGHDGIGGAVGLAEEASRFESSTEAGDTFALIASVLLDDARACAAERSPEHPRCVALSEATAYVQTVAVTAATCTGPGVFELRTRALEYLRAVERMGDGDDVAGPPVADVPSCF